MNRFFIIFTISLKFNLLIFSQNFISNGSFEDYLDCNSNNLSINNVLNCDNANTGTVDYFNSCSNYYYSTQPQNHLGFQTPLDGQGYVGFFLYSLQNGSIPNFQEYLKMSLNENLVECNIYNLSFYVSLADTFVFAINNIGAYFSQNDFFQNDFYCLNQFKPQVNNLKYRMLDDKENWMKIEGKIVSSGNEQKLIIGNFFLDEDTDTLTTYFNSNLALHAAYYYIDNVSLFLVSDETTPAYAGNDTTIYVGDSTFIGQDIYNLNCTWSIIETGEILADSISGIWVSPPETTTYLCEQNLCGNITTDTIVVSTIYRNPEISINGSVNLCMGDSLVLSTNVTNGILWHPNEETSPTITITEQGSYYLSQTVNELTTYSDTINVTFNTTPTPDLSLLEPFCDTSSTFQLNNGLPAGGIYYLNGIESTVFEPSNSIPGEYELVYQVNNANCVGFDTSSITVLACSVGLSESVSPSADGGLRGRIIPNPNSGTFTIQFNKLIEIQELNILDALGRKIQVLDDKQTYFEVKLQKGVYFLEVLTENSRILEKIVVN